MPLPFDEIWKRVLPRLKAVLARFGIPIEDGEDLVQTTLVQYLKKRDQIRDPERWLPVALDRTCKMYWRSRGRSLTVGVDQAILEIMADHVSPTQEQQVARTELAKLLATVKEKCREILQLRYLGYDRHEIAKMTGYKISGIDKVTQRCIAAVAKRFRKACSGLMGRGDRKAKPDAEEKASVQDKADDNDPADTAERTRGDSRKDDDGERS